MSFSFSSMMYLSYYCLFKHFFFIGKAEHIYGEKEAKIFILQMATVAGVELV